MTETTEQPQQKNEVLDPRQTPVNTDVTNMYGDITAFGNAQRICMSLVKSDIVPQLYRGNDKVANAMIALEMANRLKISPLAVMQNMYIVQGRPTWASSFIIAMINNSGKFGGLRFKYGVNGKVANMPQLENKTCRAYAIDKASGEVVYGPEVSMEMAVKEGWYGKNGSKWQTMPELMLSYRSAAFFGRLYVPEIMQGMHAEDEVEDLKAPTIAEPVQEVTGEIVIKDEPKSEIEGKIATITEPLEPKQEQQQPTDIFQFEE